MAYYTTLPAITELTTHQQTAVDETAALSLSGGPGTGKSLVLLWRHIRNHAIGTRNSLLLTYTKTLEHFLKLHASNENQNAAKNIDRFFDWLQNRAAECEEIIIDEGQDIIRDEFQQFLNYSDIISFGIDERQSVYLKENELKELLEWINNCPTFTDNEPITLQKNFRNSKEILLFTRSVFPNFLISQDAINNSQSSGLKPILKIVGWEQQDEIDEIVEIINDFRGDTVNIGVLVPLARQVGQYHEKLVTALPDEVEISMYQNEMDDFNELSGIHVTTFKSSKGTEFDTVIIPVFGRFQWYIGNMDVIGEKDYYVGFTRTKTNLFLICKKNPQIGDSNTYEIEKR